MNDKRFVDINYHYFSEKKLTSIIDNYAANFGILFHIGDKYKVTSIIQSALSYEKQVDGVHFVSHKGRAFFKIDWPFYFHKKIYNQQPDYVLIHGLRYGFFSFFLRKRLPKCIILVQVHGYAKSPTGIKKMIYTWVGKYIDGFLFTGKKNAQDWIDTKVLPAHKVFEIMEGSVKKPEKKSPKITDSFLWVGRLIPSKDPFTVLNAFEKYLVIHPRATLEMAFQDNTLLEAIQHKIATSTNLQKSTTLLGKLDKEELKKHYRKNQFFITGSHFEGSGYALLESMSFGCIPIITKIPSHEFMTGYGKCGCLFEVANEKSLLSTLLSLQQINLQKAENKTHRQFQEKLSFSSIAKDLMEIFETLAKNKAYE